MPHIVFTSYAQRDRDRYLDSFVKELDEELRGAIPGHALGELMFFDRVDVQAGERWSDRIIAAVNEAHLLLCLMSPTYFTRPWCGRELQAFIDRERRAQPPLSGGPFIVPIWWRKPSSPRPLPSRLGQFNHRSAGFPKAYDDDGVRGLARQGKRTQVRRVVDTLVRLIEESFARPGRLPPGQPIQKVEDILNAFDEQQPFDVRLLTLAAGGDAFKPSALDPTIAVAAETVAERLCVFVRAVETGPGLEAALQRARAEQQVLLLVVDTSGPPDAVQQQINALELPNLALLLLGSGGPGMDAASWFAAFPPGSMGRAQAAGLVRVALPGELAAQLERLVDESRRRMMASAPAAKVQAPEIAERERLQGIPTEAVSNLSGPGAERTR